MNLVKNGFLALILMAIVFTGAIGIFLLNPKQEKAPVKQELTPQKPKINIENITGPSGQAPAVFIEPETTKNQELDQFFGDFIKKNEEISITPSAIPISVPIPTPTPVQITATTQQSQENIFISDISALELEMAKNQVGELVKGGLTVPVRKDGLKELLKLLRGFGDYFKLPYDALTDPNGLFAAKDIEIVRKTIEVYHNPVNIILGEECGLPGPAFSFPPGYDDMTTACGGTPGFGGTSCNTDARCFFTGFCFAHTYSYTSGSWTYCWVPSCYGVCGNSTYIWDSVTGTCGCGH